jgi:hypothetical protein
MTKKKGEGSPEKVEEKKKEIALCYHANWSVIAEKCPNSKCEKGKRDSLAFACVVRLKPNNTVGFRPKGDGGKLDAYIVPFAELRHEKVVGMLSTQTQKVCINFNFFELLKMSLILVFIFQNPLRIYDFKISQSISPIPSSVKKLAKKILGAYKIE